MYLVKYLINSLHYLAHINMLACLKGIYQTHHEFVVLEFYQ